MDVTVIVSTFGDPEWIDLAHERAIPSAAALGCVVYPSHADTLANARNAGALHATTEWLCFLDADDELAPGYMDAMARGTCDLRGPAVQYVSNGRCRRPKVWPDRGLKDGNHLVIGTLIRQEMFLSVSGFREWELYEDWDLWQRCWGRGATVETIPQAIYIAHVRPESRNRAPGREKRLQLHHDIRRSNFPEDYPPVSVPTGLAQLRGERLTPVGGTEV